MLPYIQFGQPRNTRHNTLTEYEMSFLRLYNALAFTVPQRLDFAHRRLAPLCSGTAWLFDSIVVADRGNFTQVFLYGFGVLVGHLIHSCYFISPNNANTWNKNLLSWGISFLLHHGQQMRHIQH